MKALQFVIIGFRRMLVQSHFETIDRPFGGDDHLVRKALQAASDKYDVIRQFAHHVVIAWMESWKPVPILLRRAHVVDDFQRKLNKKQSEIVSLLHELLHLCSSSDPGTLQCVGLIRQHLERFDKLCKKMSVNNEVKIVLARADHLKSICFKCLTTMEFTLTNKAKQAFLQAREIIQQLTEWQNSTPAEELITAVKCIRATALFQFLQSIHFSAESVDLDLCLEETTDLLEISSAIPTAHASMLAVFRRLTEQAGAHCTCLQAQCNVLLAQMSSLSVLPSPEQMELEALDLTADTENKLAPFLLAVYYLRINDQTLALHWFEQSIPYLPAFPIGLLFAAELKLLQSSQESDCLEHVMSYVHEALRITLRGVRKTKKRIAAMRTLLNAPSVTTCARALCGMALARRKSTLTDPCFRIMLAKYDVHEVASLRKLTHPLMVTAVQHQLEFLVQFIACNFPLEITTPIHATCRVGDKLKIVEEEHLQQTDVFFIALQFAQEDMLKLLAAHAPAQLAAMFRAESIELAGMFHVKASSPIYTALRKARQHGHSSDQLARVFASAFSSSFHVRINSALIRDTPLVCYFEDGIARQQKENEKRQQMRCYYIRTSQFGRAVYDRELVEIFSAIHDSDIPFVVVDLNSLAAQGMLPAFETLTPSEAQRATHFIKEHGVHICKLYSNVTFCTMAKLDGELQVVVGTLHSAFQQATAAPFCVNYHGYRLAVFELLPQQTMPAGCTLPPYEQVENKMDLIPPRHMPCSRGCGIDIMLSDNSSLTGMERVEVEVDTYNGTFRLPQPAHIPAAVSIGGWMKCDEEWYMCTVGHVLCDPGQTTNQNAKIRACHPSVTAPQIRLIHASSTSDTLTNMLSSNRHEETESVFDLLFSPHMMAAIHAELPSSKTVNAAINTMKQDEAKTLFQYHDTFQHIVSMAYNTNLSDIAEIWTDIALFRQIPPSPSTAEQSSGHLDESTSADGGDNRSPTKETHYEFQHLQEVSAFSWSELINEKLAVYHQGMVSGATQGSGRRTGYLHQCIAMVCLTMWKCPDVVTQQPPCAATDDTAGESTVRLYPVGEMTARKLVGYCFIANLTSIPGDSGAWVMTMSHPAKVVGVQSGVIGPLHSYISPMAACIASVKEHLPAESVQLWYDSKWTAVHSV